MARPLTKKQLHWRGQGEVSAKTARSKAYLPSREPSGACVTPACLNAVYTDIDQERTSFLVTGGLAPGICQRSGNRCHRLTPDPSAWFLGLSMAAGGGLASSPTPAAEPRPGDGTLRPWDLCRVPAPYAIASQSGVPKRPPHTGGVCPASELPPLWQQGCCNVLVPAGEVDGVRKR